MEKPQHLTRGEFEDRLIAGSDFTEAEADAYYEWAQANIDRWWDIDDAGMIAEMFCAETTPGHRMVRDTFQLPLDLQEKLRARAHAGRVSKSEIVRQALREYLAITRR